jgi:heme/copper-type cytochrome/quinol oxidase subunit 3
MIHANGMTGSNRIKVMQSTLILLFGSETILFGTLVMSYLYFRAGGSDTPFTHPGVSDLLIAIFNTLLLAGSAGAAWASNRAIEQGQAGRMKALLLATLLMGAAFIGIQIFEFNHLGMKIDVSTFGGIFFALIMFHAAHVAAGIMVLLLNYARARLGDFTARQHVAITGGTWFWTYVTAVWLILFTVLYLV